MEHLNRRIKTIIRNLGSNVSDKSITRAGKSLGALQHVCETFEKETVGTSSTADYHPYPAFTKDLQKVVKTLEEVNVFVPQGVRWHPTFPSLKQVLLQKFTQKELVAKVKTSIDAIVYSV